MRTKRTRDQLVNRHRLQNTPRPVQANILPGLFNCKALELNIILTQYGAYIIILTYHCLWRSKTKFTRIAWTDTDAFANMRT
jgi:hypothetical protein